MTAFPKAHIQNVRVGSRFYVRYWKADVNQITNGSSDARFPEGL